jgi:peptidoglycan/LPS O-acetylase OafA/YrhL
MSDKRMDFLDFAKGFAILSIVVFHYFQPFTSGLLSKAIMVGGTGVHLFFILSGFGLGLSSTKMSTIAFYKKRFIKILVPYYLIIIVICITNIFLPLYERNNLYAIGGRLIFYDIFDKNIIGSYGYHFWFISTIVQFYILFPLIIKIKNKTTSNRFLLFSLLISLTYWLFAAIFYSSQEIVNNSVFLQYLWEFNLGIVLADRFLTNGEKFWNKNEALIVPIAILGIGLMAFLSLKGGIVGQIFNDVPASIGYVAIVILAYRITFKISMFSYIISYVGIISYELYLFHMFIYALLNTLFLKFLNISPSVLMTFLIILPVSICIAKLFSYLTLPQISRIRNLHTNWSQT